MMLCVVECWHVLVLRKVARVVLRWRGAMTGR
jgi:hypothetical protein